MFVYGDNCSTVYIHKQCGSFTAFDILVSFKPFDRFNMITKHIPMSLFYAYIKSLFVEYCLLTKYYCTHHSGFEDKYAQKMEKYRRKSVCKNNSIMLQELGFLVQYSTAYHMAAFVHQSLRKEIKKPSFNPLAHCFQVSFDTANHIHQSYHSCVDQETKTASCILHPFFREDKSTLSNHVDRHINLKYQVLASFCALVQLNLFFSFYLHSVFMYIYVEFQQPD